MEFALIAVLIPLLAGAALLLRRGPVAQMRPIPVPADPRRPRR